MVAFCASKHKKALVDSQQKREASCLAVHHDNSPPLRYLSTLLALSVRLTVKPNLGSTHHRGGQQAMAEMTGAVPRQPLASAGQLKVQLRLSLVN